MGFERKREAGLGCCEGNKRFLEMDALGFKIGWREWEERIVSILIVHQIRDSREMEFFFKEFKRERKDFYFHYSFNVFLVVFSLEWLCGLDVVLFWIWLATFFPWRIMSVIHVDKQGYFCNIVLHLNICFFIYNILSKKTIFFLLNIT